MAKSNNTIDNVADDSTKEVNNLVIADFYLPGCCTFDDDCNSMCITEEEMKELAIPPFAKSDYITTSQNTRVNIYAFLNDDPIYGDKVIIAPGMFQEITAKGGRVRLSSDRKFFIYQPLTGFVGNDEFNYVIRNSVNGLSDGATVYIDVKEANVNTTVEPTISVQPSICGGRKSAFIPITITKGSYTNSVFTIQGEASLPWLDKDVSNGEPVYSINPAKFSQSTTITLALVRDGAPTNITTSFDVVVVDASFTYLLAMASRTTYKADLGGISGDFTKYVSPIYLVQIELQNTSSVEAVNFEWSMIDNNGNVLLSENKTTRDAFTWTVNKNLMDIGVTVKLVAYSKNGCIDTASEYISTRIK